MKVLITGGGGFVGKYLVQQLLGLNIKVVIMGRVRPNNYTGDFIQTDILMTKDLDNIFNQVKADCLIHLAWYTEHQLFWGSEINLRWIDASVRLVEAFCSAGGKKLIALGSCAEYALNSGYCHEDKTPVDPISLYGVSKDVTRNLISVICEKYGVEFVWARIFFPFGLGENSKKLIPSLISYFKNNQKPFAVNNEASRDFIHVTDVSNAIVYLLNNKVFGCFNICSGKPTKIADLVKIIARVYSRQPKSILDMVSHKKDAGFIVGDCSRLEALGWRGGNTELQLTEYCNQLS